MSVRNDEEQPQVMSASVQDVRYFAALLRGVNFANRATVIVNKSGLTVTVEEARTLLGTAYIFSDVFDEYDYQPESKHASSSQNSIHLEDDGAEQNLAFEVQLDTLIECLNIFGTAGASSSISAPKYRHWRQPDEDSDHDDDGGSGRRNKRSKPNGEGSANGRIDQYFGAGKGTGMRLSYAGPGYPLTMLIAEDVSGPTATCEITTFDSEPYLELPFDSDNTLLKIILKSSWLRDALSELDPSCEKLTIIGNPPPAQPASRAPRAAAASQPRLRLKAAGTFGSTEMDYPSDKEVLETCECPEQVTFSYRFNHINRALRALQSSSKTSLRIDQDGLLSLQFLMPSPRPRPGKNADGFIEFRCMALDESA